MFLKLKYSKHSFYIARKRFFFPFSNEIKIAIKLPGVITNALTIWVNNRDIKHVKQRKRLPRVGRDILSLIG